MNIKISCIIPYYNVEKELLFECINSILHQDFQNYEIIIVDDGSNEVHAAYLDEISKLDSRIKIIHQDNIGVSAARNKGIANAKGDYVTFVDADDMIMPFFFSEAYNIASKNNADYVVGKVVHTSFRNQKIIRSQEVDFKVIPSDEYKLLLIVIDKTPQGEGYFGRGPVARLIKRDILRNTLFLEDIKLGEDEIWNLDVISKCDKVYMVNQIWYFYWNNFESASNKYYEDIISISEQHLNEILKRIDLNEEREVIIYFRHVYEFLYRHIYKCYVGRKECTLSFFKRNRVICELCKKEPWLINQFKSALKYSSKKTRLNYILFRSGFLYYFWFFRDQLRKNN